jgi:hypothetical protein
MSTQNTSGSGNVSQLLGHVDRHAGDLAGRVDKFAEEYGHCLLRGLPLDAEAASMLAGIIRNCRFLTEAVESLKRAWPPAQAQPTRDAPDKPT